MKTLLIGILAVAVAVLGAWYLVNQSTVQPLGVSAGPTHTETQEFLAGYRTGLNTSNSVTANKNCTTASWNPGSISSTTIATTSVTGVVGIALGDIVSASLNTSTVSSTGVIANLFGGISTAGVATGTIDVSLHLPNALAGNWDITTTTLTVCATRL